jgi:CBS domain-containing protein
VVTVDQEPESAPKRGLPATIHTVPPETPVFEVAQVMDAEGVGDVLVAWDRKPIGLLTDRDLVVRVLAQGLNPKTLLVWEVMSKPLVLASGTQDLGEAVGLMVRHGIRRLPIVDEAGRVDSILTLDDLLLLGLNGRSNLRAIIQGQLESKKAGAKLMAGEEQGLSFRDIAPITHAFSAAVAVARNRAQDVCTVISEAPIKEAAQAMVARDVGDVFVVVDQKPVGILTDRDLVVRGMAVGADPETTLAWEVMTQPLVTVTDDEGVEGAVALMARHGIRRLPIVDEAGHLISVLTLDDILLLGLNGNLDLSEILKRQLRPRAVPPRPDLPVPPSPAAVEPPLPPPPSVTPVPLSEMRAAPPGAVAPRPQPPAQPAGVAPVSPQPEALSPVKMPSFQPKPAPETAAPADRSRQARPAAESPLHPSRTEAGGRFGGVRFSQPVTSVARTTIIKPFRHPRRTMLGCVRSWFFGSRDWLEAMAWLIILGLLLGALAYLAMGSGWLTSFTQSSYQPKDEERRQYLERLQKEREQESQSR